MNYLTHLACSHCDHQYDADELIRLCLACGYPLLARYDLKKAARELDRDAITGALRIVVVTAQLLLWLATSVFLARILLSSQQIAADNLCCTT